MCGPDDDQLSRVGGGSDILQPNEAACRLRLRMPSVQAFLGAGTGGERLSSMAWLQARTATGLALEPQYSENLVDWTTAAAHPTGVENASAIEWEVIVGSTGVPKLFLRLNVRRSP